jgi:hypothetical protein
MGNEPWDEDEARPQQQPPADPFVAGGWDKLKNAVRQSFADVQAEQCLKPHRGRDRR